MTQFPGMRMAAIVSGLLACLCAGAYGFAPAAPDRVPVRLSAGAGRLPCCLFDQRRSGRARLGFGRGVHPTKGGGWRVCGRRSSCALRMGGYEVSSAKSMGTEYTFLAAKCFVNGAVQPAEVKVMRELSRRVSLRPLTLDATG